MSGEGLPPIHTGPKAQPTTTQQHGDYASAHCRWGAAAMNVPVRRTALNISPECKHLSESDQVCEQATSVTVGVLVELDTEKNLTDWETEVTIPTLPTHELFSLPVKYQYKWLVIISGTTKL